MLENHYKSDEEAYKNYFNFPKPNYQNQKLIKY